MDEHQRRVWARMIEEIKRFRDGEIELRKLVQDLQGLMGGADLHDGDLIDEFWNHEAPIDMELELRTEQWAPEGSASDARLEQALTEFAEWAQRILDTTDDDRV